MDVVVNWIQNNNSRRGEGGGVATIMFRKIFGQNAHDSGNSSWDKTEKKKKEKTTVIPKRQAKWTPAKSRCVVSIN